MLEWLKTLFAKKKPQKTYGWDDLLSGDYVEISLKDPRSIGIISDPSMTFQRLDADDLATLKIKGYVVATRLVNPGKVELLEIEVVKRRGSNTRLMTYTILREEVESLKLLEGNA